MTSLNNVARLRSILNALKINVSQVAKLTNYSRPFVSRIIHGDEKLAKNTLFWKTLEENFSRLVEMRQVHIFEIPSVETSKLESLLQPK